MGANILKKYYIYFDNRNEDTYHIGIGLKNPDFNIPSPHNPTYEPGMSFMEEFLIIVFCTALVVIFAFWFNKKRVRKAQDFGDVKRGKKDS